MLIPCVYTTHQVYLRSSALRCHVSSPIIIISCSSLTPYYFSFGFAILKPLAKIIGGLGPGWITGGQNFGPKENVTVQVSSVKPIDSLHPHNLI